MAPTTLYCGPGPERMLSGVTAAPMVAAVAVPDNITADRAARISIRLVCMTHGLHDDGCLGNALPARLFRIRVRCSGTMVPRSESDHSSVQIIFVGALNFHCGDFADTQWTFARHIDSAVDLRRVGHRATLRHCRTD